MDCIDITDSAFSLDAPNMNNMLTSTGGGSSTNDYMFLYIGIAILVALGGMYIFRVYKNKKNGESNENYMDCEGGFCMMNQNINSNS